MLHLGCEDGMRFVSKYANTPIQCIDLVFENFSRNHGLGTFSMYIKSGLAEELDQDLIGEKYRTILLSPEPPKNVYRSPALAFEYFRDKRGNAIRMVEAMLWFKVPAIYCSGVFVPRNEREQAFYEKAIVGRPRLEREPQPPFEIIS